MNLYLEDRTYTVMVVDDNPDNLELLEDILYSRGYGVAAFLDGEMALNAASRNPPDVILLDIMMPGMDGFQICRKMKTLKQLKDVPVIFISALEDTSNKLKAFTRGGVDYITKPIQEEEVLARINTHLKLSKMQLELKNKNEHLEELVQEQVKEISDSQIATLVAISSLAESRDDDTGQHIERTRIYCRKLACKLQEFSEVSATIDNTFINNIYQAAPLHDIGKTGIPDSILLKPGKLTPEEFDQMKSHVLIGSTSLERVRAKYPGNAFINMGIELTRHHHEKWDGSGYPDGLAGKEIPLCARIMALADVYDALRSKRPYKKAFSHKTSAEIIIQDSGKHFDPVVVKAFEALESEFERIRKSLNIDEDD